ncbi:hypothetical protein QYE76_060462 [Lolium multiflorum]|uniref:WRC domain-containing protein n=1 Tax=Lolium multiflorum TaxID=4521 RepID=A0AAD8S271_LOLMU|nr:hypothetical protein QYE76_060462 [Lolium multiflorum]
MKIRLCANLLLGVDAPISTPPRFELPMSPRSEFPPSPRFDLPPPTHESHPGFPFKTSSSMPEPCETSFIPWDLMDELDLSDSQEEERFMETYSVPIAGRASWLSPPNMKATSIMEDVEKEEISLDMVNEVKDEEKGDMSMDMVNGFILGLCAPKGIETKMAGKKNKSKLKTKKGKELEKEEKNNNSRREVWMCKKNDGKGWFCQRPASQPNSLCTYHYDRKLLVSSKQRRSKMAYNFGDAVGEGFYYYAGFGPSRSNRRSISNMLKTPLPDVHEQQHAELDEHIDVIPGPDHGDGVDGVDNGCKRDEDDMSKLAGLDEEISSEEHSAVGCNSEPFRGMMKRVSKKQKRKHVNTLSINLITDEM